MRVLFATSSFGLGHATRDLPLIQGLQREGYEVVCMSTGKALHLLKSELPNCMFVDVNDYPNFFNGKGMSLHRLVRSVPMILRTMKREHRLAEDLVRKYECDMIVTDGRYGVYSKCVPSYWVSHQLRFIAPRRFKPVEVGSLGFHRFVQKRFAGIFVPDYEHDSLSGDLCHNLTFIDKKKLNYIGVLSSVQKQDVKEDVDYFVSLSAGLSSSEAFQSLVLEQVSHLDGKVVVTKGNPHKSGKVVVGNVEIHEYLNREEQAQMMNRAKRVICRSGYTTIMELAELGKRALFVPTPGHTEQVYLAKFHASQGNFGSQAQDTFFMKTLVDLFEGYTGVKRKCSTSAAVEKFLSVVSK